MKKTHVFTKTIWQIIIYFFEILSISFLITYLTNYLDTIMTYMEFLERMILSYTIYQIIVIVILTNLNDIQKDSYLALITTLKLCLLYSESNDPEIKKYIFTIINHQLDKSVFNSALFNQIYEKLQTNLDFLTETQLRVELINAEHCYEATSLNWKYSFLLRLSIFK